jgi:hypothetical protein
MTNEPLQVRAARPEELTLLADWAAGEGWNPGRADMECFAAQDSDADLSEAWRLRWIRERPRR